jgi:hypothetical protein
MSWSDVVLGLVFIGMDMVFDLIWNKISKVSKWTTRSAGRHAKRPNIGRHAALRPNYYKNGLQGLVNLTARGPLGGKVAKETLRKTYDHLAKSWIFTPMAGGVASQLALRPMGVSKAPGVGILRGNYLYIGFFPAGLGNAWN